MRATIVEGTFTSLRTGRPKRATVADGLSTDAPRQSLRTEPSWIGSGVLFSGEEEAVTIRIRCDWCPHPITGKAWKGEARRQFCCRECKKAWEDFQNKIFDPVRIYPIVERFADV